MSKPIRVLLIAPSFHILGGQSVQASRILGEMRKEPGIAMTFQPINPRLPAPLDFVYNFRFIRTIVTYLLYLPMVLVRAFRTDILHIFSAATSSYTLWSLPAILIGKLYGKKVILNYRDGQCEDHLTHWKTAIPTIRLVDAIVTPSGYLVDVFARFGLKAQSIFNFIDTSRFRYRRRGPVRPAFMTNRILEPLYNVPCILRAFQKIQQRYPEASLKIAHDGVCRPSLEQLAAGLGLRHVQFLGRVPHPKVPDLYHEAEIYLTTPNIDCMPGSLLECFASGLPIIATKAGGIPYIVTHEKNALLVDLDNDEAVARSAFRLLEEPGLVERLTSAGRDEVKRYNGDEVRTQWVALYRQLRGSS
ncbi:MAG TPA: glycosyltransferase family 4 protein [Bryobacteraceae bacterium]|nr:glycosyltransferase family 4 protein [Bryobacteraceae bacterium]